jgi:hypothetical protein
MIKQHAMRFLAGISRLLELLKESASTFTPLSKSYSGGAMLIQLHLPLEQLNLLRRNVVNTWKSAVNDCILIF